jgi:chitodextrinase
MGPALMRRAIVRTLAFLIPVLVVPAVFGTSSAGGHCARSGPQGGGFKVTVCITAPAEGAVLSGDSPVTATATTSDGRKVHSLRFFLDGKYVLTDFQGPFEFLLPTAQWVDDPLRALSVQARVRSSSDWFYSEEAAISVGFSNGVSVPPPRPRTFEPREPQPASQQPLVVAAVGDGVDGGTIAGQVIEQIDSWNPDMLLYLGDVYDRGTYTEFVNWAGDERWGRFYSITNPAPGNHEYQTKNAAGYLRYWASPPNYFAADTGDWHIVSLDSSEEFNQTQPGTGQYDWLADDLWYGDANCSLVFFHHSPFDLSSEGGTTRMRPIFSLAAGAGVDLVVSAHDHNYIRWKPMAAGGIADPDGTTAFVVGTGGHFLYPFERSDSRVARGIDSNFGALRLELWQDRADFAWVTKGGAVLDSGTVPCSPAQDHQPPTAPELQANATAPDQIDLEWSESTDNRGIDGYRVYRDGGLLATLGPDRLTYADICLPPATSFSYEVEAFDASSNVARSEPAVASTDARSDFTPPGVPPDLTVTAVDAYELKIDWGPAIDDVGVCSYRVKRDGSPLVVTKKTHVRDGDLEPDTSYTYEVRSVDAAGNVSEPADVVGKTPPLLFTDDFETGDLSAWNVVQGLEIETDPVHAGKYAVRASGRYHPAYGVRDLAVGEPDLYARVWFRTIEEIRDPVTLLRLRGGGSGIAAVGLSEEGQLSLLNEFTGSYDVSSIQVSSGTWHRLQLRVEVEGDDSRIGVWYDGSRVGALSGPTSLGTTAVGRVQIGEHQDRRMFEFVLDDVAADTTFIR